MIFTSSSKTRHTSRCLHQRLLPVGRSGRAFARRPRLADRSPFASSSLDPSPLMGLSKDCPFVDIRFERPLPGALGSARARLQSLPSVRICHVPTRSVLAVPPGFDGLLRSSAAGLLHPAADHGVHYVSSLECEFHRCFPLDCSGLPLDLPHHADGFPVVCDPGSHHGSPFEGFPSISAVPHRCAGRHRKALHDNASARAFFGSPHRARARASLRFQLPGLSTCLPGAAASDRTTAVAQSCAVPSRRCRPTLLHRPSALDLGLLPCRSLPAGCRSAHPLDLRVLIRDGVRCVRTRLRGRTPDPPLGFFSSCRRCHDRLHLPEPETRLRRSLPEPVDDRSSPSHTRPRRSPQALADLPTFSGPPGLPLGFRWRCSGSRVTPVKDSGTIGMVRCDPK